MALSKQKDSLFDPYRNSWVIATPEELVRQSLLSVMTNQLGFPKTLLSIEVSLTEIPHLKGIANLPKRRADIICFAKGINKEHSLYPLLLIECKEGDFGHEAYAQVKGYNHFIQALYVAVAGEKKVELIYPQSLPFLPSYHQLMENACK